MLNNFQVFIVFVILAIFITLHGLQVWNIFVRAREIYRYNMRVEDCADDDGCGCAQRQTSCCCKSTTSDHIFFFTLHISILAVLLLCVIGLIWIIVDHFRVAPAHPPPVLPTACSAASLCSSKIQNLESVCSHKDECIAALDAQLKSVVEQYSQKVSAAVDQAVADTRSEYDRELSVQEDRLAVDSKFNALKTVLAVFNSVVSTVSDEPRATVEEVLSSRPVLPRVPSSRSAAVRVPVDDVN
jgi:hypothetical protein